MMLIVLLCGTVVNNDWTSKEANLLSSSNNLCRVFPAGGMGALPPQAENLLIPPTRRIPPSRFSPYQIYILPLPKVNPLTKQQFSSYNPIKTVFLAVVTAPAPFLF